MGALPPRAALEDADAVFLGEVVARRDIDVTESGFPAAFGYTLRVSRAWKGAATDTVEIGTSSIGTACGSHFVIGEEYLVYAGGGGVAGATSFLGGQVVTETAMRPRLWTSSCSRTQSYAAAEHRDLTELGEPSWVNPDIVLSLLSNELFVACQKGETARVRELLRTGHDVNGKDRRWGQTALIAAASGGHADTVRVLLEAGARVNKMKRDTTALVEAAKRGHAETVQVLLEAGANPNDARTESSPLVAAILSGELAVIAQLLDGGAESAGNALLTAARRGELDVIDLLLRSGATADSPTKYGRTALAVASNQGHIEVVKRLLAAGADVNRPSSSHGTSLDFAARKGHIEIVRALLASGARVRQETLLAAAAQGRELLELLQKARAAPSDAGMEVSADMLIRASHGKDTSALELLLEEEPDLEARNKNGQTALVLGLQRPARGDSSAAGGGRRRQPDEPKRMDGADAGILLRAYRSHEVSHLTGR